MRPWLLRLLAVALVVGLPPAMGKADRAVACVCVGQLSPQQEMQGSDAVLAGSVVAVYLSEDQRRAIFEMEVARWWKGDHYETVYLTSSGSPCAVWYERSNQIRPLKDYVGKSYLIYADRWDDQLIPDHCGNTEEIGSASDIQALGVGATPVPGTSAPRPAVLEEQFRYPLSAWATGVLAFVVLAVAGVGFLIVRSWRQTSL